MTGQEFGKTFQRLYGAKPFDDTDPQNILAEDARKLILSTAIGVTGKVKGGEDMPYLLGGLLVGIVQILQATARSGGGITQDKIDAAIRASIVQIAPWAVDMARSAEGKDPLGGGLQ